MAPANDQQTHSVTRMNSQDREDIVAINAAVDRMRACTPADPYILSVPQDVEPQYRHTYAFQARQWLENTPFDRGEHESIQYQTFVFHEPGPLYMLRNSRLSDSSAGVGKNGKVEVKVKEKPGTGSNTPNAAPKKKISLDAYKKKQAGVTPEGTPARTSTQQVKKQATKGPVERLKVDEEMLAIVEADDDVLMPPAEAKKDLKRKRDDGVSKDTKAETQVKHHDTPQEQEEPATKKAKPTPSALQAKAQAEKPAAQVEKKSTAQVEKPAAHEQYGGPAKSPEKPSHPVSKTAEEITLPPKLSPPPSSKEDSVLPPKLSPISMPALPPRLSPTIPANIAATLKARAHYRSTSRSSDVSVSKDASGPTLTPPRRKNEPAITKKKSPAPRNGFRANSSSPAVRSDNEERGRPLTSVPPRMQPSDPESAEDSEEVAVAKVKKPVLDKPPSMIVKLKFKKATRESVRRILKMRQNPKKEVASQPLSKKADEVKSAKGSDQRHRERRDTNAKGVAQRVGPVSTTNGVTKRERHSSSEPERKRPRAEYSDESDGQRRNTNAKGVAQRVGPASTANGVTRRERHSSSERERKRPRVEYSDESDGQLMTKRKKANTNNTGVRRQETEKSALLKGPSTPPVQSNLLSPSSIVKPTSQLTPTSQLNPSSQPTSTPIRKDILSTAFKRDNSTDNHIHTPSAITHISPPDNDAHSSTSTSAPMVQPSPKTPRQQAWETEQKRLEDIGRDLKHAAQTHAAVSPNPTLASTTTEQKLAAVKSLESLIAYMLAFTCADEAAIAADPARIPSVRPWRTLHGYIGFVKQSCAVFPELLGLACHLRVVYNARILDLMEQDPAQLVMNQFFESFSHMQRAANEADAKLDVDKLESSFPRTFAARFRGGLGTETLQPGQGFDGNYKLPMNVATSPLRAARAGYGMLAEWLVRQEGLDYVLKLRL